MLAILLGCRNSSLETDMFVILILLSDRLDKYMYIYLSIRMIKLFSEHGIFHWYHKILALLKARRQL